MSLVRTRREREEPKRPQREISLRQAALAALASGTKAEDVAQQFGVCRRTLVNWQKLARTGSVAPRVRTGRPRSISVQDEPRVLDFLRAHPTLTSVQVSERLLEELGLKAGPRTLSRLLMRHGIRTGRRGLSGAGGGKHGIGGIANSESSSNNSDDGGGGGGGGDDDDDDGRFADGLFAAGSAVSLLDSAAGPSALSAEGTRAGGPAAATTIEAIAGAETLTAGTVTAAASRATAIAHVVPDGPDDSSAPSLSLSQDSGAGSPYSEVVRSLRRLRAQLMPAADPVHSGAMRAADAAGRTATLVLLLPDTGTLEPAAGAALVAAALSVCERAWRTQAALRICPLSGRADAAWEIEQLQRAHAVVAVMAGDAPSVRAHISFALARRVPVLVRLLDGVDDAALAAYLGVLAAGPGSALLHVARDETAAATLLPQVLGTL